jgi:hypothetical protein
MALANETRLLIFESMAGNKDLSPSRPSPLPNSVLKAKQGDADAQYNLGFLYANGERMTLGYAEATYWYRCDEIRMALFTIGPGHHRPQGLATQWDQ